MNYKHIKLIFKNLFLFFLLNILENYIFFLKNYKHYNQWNILYCLYILNNIMEYPLIIIIHIYLCFNIIKIKKIKKNKIKYIFIYTLIPLIGLFLKIIIKKKLHLLRPYIHINNIKKYNCLLENFNYLNIPIWLKKYWKTKNDHSFPSGHSIFINNWLIIFQKHIKQKYIYFIIYIILFIILISRIILHLHNSKDILGGYIINKIMIFIIFRISKILNFL